jgi:Restriction Enzyme Adenine Methylase Associated
VLEGRGVRLSDLLDADFISPGDKLIWARPGTGEIYYASLTDNGCIDLEDGRVFSGPSRAAVEVAGIPAYDGWQAWRVGGADGELLDQLRARLIRRWAEIEDEPTDEVEDSAQREPTRELEERAEGRGDGDSHRGARLDGTGDPQGVA